MHVPSRGHLVMWSRGHVVGATRPHATQRRELRPCPVSAADHVSLSAPRAGRPAAARLPQRPKAPGRLGTLELRLRPRAWACLRRPRLARRRGRAARGPGGHVPAGCPRSRGERRSVTASVPRDNEEMRRRAAADSPARIPRVASVAPPLTRADGPTGSVDKPPAGSRGRREQGAMRMRASQSGGGPGVKRLAGRSGRCGTGVYSLILALGSVSAAAPAGGEAESV